MYRDFHLLLPYLRPVRQPVVFEVTMTFSRSLFSLCALLAASVVFGGCLTANPDHSANPVSNPDGGRTLQDLIDEGEAGDPGVQFYLGWWYETQRDEPQSNYEARRWYRMAAEQDYVDAQYRLAVLHDQGRGIEQDFGEAVRWYRRAADLGHAKSQYNLAMMYDLGEGVERDQAEAAAWYRVAGEQGYAPAQNNLGVLYANGEGVAVDAAEAVKWYRMAADQGYSRAQYNLGMMYYYGRSVRQSFVEAYAWCYLSMVNGGDPETLRYIVRHLDSAEIRSALRRAGELQKDMRRPWTPPVTIPDEAETGEP